MVKLIIQKKTGVLYKSIGFYLGHIIHNQWEHQSKLNNCQEYNGNTRDDAGCDRNGENDKMITNANAGSSVGGNAGSDIGNESDIDSVSDDASDIDCSSILKNITFYSHLSTGPPRGSEYTDYTLAVSGFTKTADCQYNVHYYLCNGNNDTRTVFSYKGVRYNVSIITESDDPIAGDYGTEFYCDIQIETNGSSSNFRDFIEEARIYYKKYIQCTDKIENTILYYIYDDDYWRPLNRKQKRSLDTIYLPKDTKSKIYNDFKKFLNPKTKQKYQEYGIPYKRNYLLEGVPGTGKTSLISALASEFDLNISIMSFNSKTTDNVFMTSLTQLDDNTLLVLEDIDTLFQDRKKNDELKNMVTFSGILNCMDGFGYMEGLIIIMTTNYIKRLDPALIRTGRVDMVLHFDYAVKEQIIEIFNKFFPKKDANLFYKEIKRTRVKVTTSMLQHYLFNHLENGLVFENISELTKLAQDNKFEKQADGFYT